MPPVRVRSRTRDPVMKRTIKHLETATGRPADSSPESGDLDLRERSTETARLHEDTFGSGYEAGATAGDDDEPAESLAPVHDDEGTQSPDDALGLYLRQMGAIPLL